MAQSFTGRERERALLDEHARPGHMIALVGPSGVGKTTIASGWLKNRSEPSEFFDCFGQSPLDVANSIAATDGTEVSSLPRTSAWIRAAEQLSDTEILVLDDIRPDFGGLETFRANWGGLLVTTSHHVPEADDVSVLPVTPFEVPDVDDLTDSDCYRLFVGAARDVDVGFEIDPDELSALHELIRHFDGYPLALALAGRRAATVTVGEVLRLVRQHSALADQGRPERHRTLDAALDVSWNALAPEDCRLLYSMALFERPVRVEILALLAEQSAGEVLDRLEVLTRSGLVLRAAFPRPIEPFVTYALRRFPEQEPDAAEEIVARVHVEAARLALELDEDAGYESRFGEGPSLWRFVLDEGDPGSLDEVDRQVLMTAFIRWAGVRSDFARLEGSPFVDLLDESASAATLCEFATAVAISDEGLARWALGEAQQRNPDTITRQRIHVTMARLHTFQREPAAALEELRAARELGPLDAEGERVRALASYHAGEMEAVRDAYDRARALSREGPGQPISPAMLDIGLLVAESPEQTIALARRLVEYYERLQHLPRLGEATIRLAEAHARHAEGLETALDCATKARALFSKLGDTVSDTRVRGLQIELHIARGDYEAARQTLDDVGSRPHETQTHAEVFTLLDALVSWQLGNLESARQKLASVRDHWMGSTHRLLSTMFWIGELGVRLESGATDEAAQLLDQVRDTADARAMNTLRCMWNAAADEELLDSELRDTLGAWSHARPIQRLFRDFVHRIAPRPLVRVESNAGADADLTILEDYSAFRVDEEWVELSGQTLNAALLEMLVEADAPLDFDELGEALYPDEVIAYAALKNRVSVQVSRLRKLGLKPYIAKEPEGFVLRAEVAFAGTPD